MGSLLSTLFRFIAHNLWLFGVIVLFLVTSNWIRAEWGSIQHIVSNLPGLVQAEKDIDARRVALTSELASRIKNLHQGTLQELDRQSREIDATIHRLEQEEDEAGVLPRAMAAGRDLPVFLSLSIKRKVELELLHQAKHHLLVLRDYASAAANRKAALQKRERLRQAHAGVYAQLRANLAAQAALRAAFPFAVRVPFHARHTEMVALENEEKTLKAANIAARNAYETQDALVQRLPDIAVPGFFQPNEARISRVMAPLREEIEQAQQLVGRSYLWQAYTAVESVLLAAGGVLTAWYVIPAGIRAAFYWVLAPFAARRPAIVVDGSATGEVRPHGQRGSTRLEGTPISGVSKTFTLEPGHELLIRPRYSQSLPMDVKTRTIYLFDWTCPLTSMAAQLWMLKRVWATVSAEIVVSSSVDALDEVAVLDVPEGASFVLQPRALVGVMFRTGEVPRIQKHWRLLSLHAWMTLQLRYLSFRGPVTLIVKGRRGVRLECANLGRTISQAATLGFSANTRYTTTRAEPFLPYLLGHQTLLQDRFVGADSYYLYEEMPQDAMRGKHRFNPLNILFEAGLKAFGI